MLLECDAHGIRSWEPLPATIASITDSMKEFSKLFDQRNKDFDASEAETPSQHSVGSDKLDKRTIDNRANFSIIDYRPSIMIIYRSRR